MDDFKQSRYMRRLALVAAITCSATAVYAADSATNPSSSFRSLIARGWNQSAPAKTESMENIEARNIALEPVEQTPNTDDLSPLAVQSQPAEIKPLAAAEDHGNNIQTADVANRTAAESNAVESIVAPTPAAIDQDTKQANTGLRRQAGDLAKLIRSHARTIAVPKMNADDTLEPEPSNDLEAPPAPVGEQESIAVAVPETAPAAIVEGYSESDSERLGVPEIAANDPANANVAQLAPVGPQFPIAVPKSLEELAPFVAQQPPVPPQPPQPAVTPRPAMPAQPTVTEQPLASTSTDVPSPTAVVDDLASELTLDAAQPAESSLMADSSNSRFDQAVSAIPENAGKSLSDEPTYSVTDESAIGSSKVVTDKQLEAPIRIKPNTVAINQRAVRLREAARQSFENANQRLMRGATHSAKMYAMQTLRSIAAMQDALVGGNLHTTQLQAALDAIRESRDFGGSFGTVDQIAMQRMVAVHRTLALKDRDLASLSAVEASEAYLAVAGENLVAAAAGAPKASDALVILGKVERVLATTNNAHAAAVAMTMQDAAVQIAPNSAFAHYELGVTLIEQGLIQDAAYSLQRGVALRPTRRGYQKLLQVSRQCGDIDTVQSCLVALKSDHLQTDIPVHLISPDRFAATHRPAPGSYAGGVRQIKTNTATAAKAKPDNHEPTRVSWRTIIPFGSK